MNLALTYFDKLATSDQIGFFKYGIERETMATSRAEGVAEVLWELKRADKISVYGVIAKRAGFSAGTNGRAMITAMKNVRRDWPHLQWWRAIKDDGLLEKDGEQAQELAIAGYEIAAIGQRGFRPHFRLRRTYYGLGRRRRCC